MPLKEAKPKTCAICKGEFVPFSTTSRVCSPTCALEFNRQKDIKKAAKEIARIYGPQRSNTKKSNPLKTRKRAAKEICHLYIRTRDKGDDCICCGEPLGDDYHAGHFIESGSGSKIRYDEDNIHAQRLHCNSFKGGDSGMYRVNLIKKIGIKRVERLESMKSLIVKRTVKDYLEIEKYYKDKLKVLNNATNQ